MELTIGPRLYSTWSLRPWLVLKRAGAQFTTRDVRYDTPEGKAALNRISPTGLVPLLTVDGEMFWDSLAISEWAAETYPQARLWPADKTARAYARSVTAEMHSGFSVLREHCGFGGGQKMVGPGTAKAEITPELEANIRRLVTLFNQMRGRYGETGPWLFGEWSIADAFYTPVALRVRRYQIDLAAYGDSEGVATQYVAHLLTQPDFLEWEATALS